MSKAIVVAVRRSMTIPGVMRVSMGLIGIRRTIAVTLVRMRGTMAIPARAGAITVGRTSAPIWRTDALMTILVDDRHTIMVLYYGAAVFAIFVDEKRRITIFDGCSEILPIRGEHRRRLSAGRSGATNKKRYSDNLSHTVLHSIIDRSRAAPQIAEVTTTTEPGA